MNFKKIDIGIEKARLISQLTFVFFSVWIGIEFYMFVKFLQSNGAAAFYVKPGGAEAFLPISSFMSLYYFILTGIINTVHPAGFFIFLTVLIISFVYGKSFCSWVCPIGFISEHVGDFGDKLQKKIFGKIYRLPKIIDYPLRSIKYLIMGFFVWSILSMSADQLKGFLDSPYNKVADLKLWFFFVDITRYSLTVIAILFILSIPIKNFWCRYLCPYGALLGIFSLLSLNKIKRNKTTCINCNLCTKACPHSIKVHKVNYVISDECTTCLDCVEVCPVEDTLYLENVITKKKSSKYSVPVFVLGAFLLVNVTARLTDHWYSKITPDEYISLYQNINSFDHLAGNERFKNEEKTRQSEKKKKFPQDKSKKEGNLQ